MDIPPVAALSNMEQKSTLSRSVYADQLNKLTESFNKKAKHYNKAPPKYREKIKSELDKLSDEISYVYSYII